MHDLQLIGENVKLELKKSAVKMPQNYSFENAVKSAYLILLETQDRNKRPVLEVCTPESIHNAILDMAVQGLNPQKSQCSFIAYGTKLVCQREYMGSIAVAMRVDPAIKYISAQPIYRGDKVSIKVVNGIKQIEHEQDFMALEKDDIIGAYAMAVDADGNQIHTDIMTMDEIHRSWRQSKMNPVTESGKVNPQSTHGRFTEEMTRKTIYNRLCKKIINTSDDSQLLKSFEATDEESIIEEIKQPAQLIPLDFKKDTPLQPLPESQPEIETASRDQAKQIYELEERAGRADKILQTLSAFTNRQIGKLSELTAQEAINYIRIVELELESKNDEKQAGPSWG